MSAVVAAMRKVLKPFDAELEAVNCHHNYVTRENHFGENALVTRKGAVRAAKGTMGNSRLDGREKLYRARLGECRKLLFV